MTVCTKSHADAQPKRSWLCVREWHFGDGGPGHLHGFLSSGHTWDSISSSWQLCRLYQPHSRGEYAKPQRYTILPKITQSHKKNHHRSQTSGSKAKCVSHMCLAEWHQLRILKFKFACFWERVWVCTFQFTASPTMTGIVSLNLCTHLCDPHGPQWPLNLRS